MKRAETHAPLQRIEAPLKAGYGGAGNGAKLTSHGVLSIATLNTFSDNGFDPSAAAAQASRHKPGPAVVRSGGLPRSAVATARRRRRCGRCAQHRRRGPRAAEVRANSYEAIPYFQVADRGASGRAKIAIAVMR
jgi:hypothetical protein